MSKTTPKPGLLLRSAQRFATVWRYWLWRVIRWGVIVMAGFVLLSALLVVLFRIANPYLTYYYVSERARLGAVERVWTPLQDFSPHMARAVVAAEDANFCEHYGFDVAAIRAALSDTSRLRGGSTISQQVAKNVFLWQGRTWLRKGLEAWFTVLIELIWPKARIVEVYLNIAEFDEGVFGAAAAGQHYFERSPDRLSLTQAARLAAVLPNPKNRSASRPSSAVQNRTRQIISGAETITADGRADCFSAVETGQ